MAKASSSTATPMESTGGLEGAVTLRFTSPQVASVELKASLMDLIKLPIPFWRTPWNWKV